MTTRSPHDPPRTLANLGALALILSLGALAACRQAAETTAPVGKPPRVASADPAPAQEPARDDVAQVAVASAVAGQPKDERPVAEVAAGNESAQRAPSRKQAVEHAMARREAEAISAMLAAETDAFGMPAGAAFARPAPAEAGFVHDTEAYAPIAESGFRRAIDSPLSTFSIDVDTASYSNVRRFLLDMGTLPPKDAVRIEEMLNTFRYDDAEPSGDDPFAVTTEVAPCPWEPRHRLARIALRGRSIDARDLPARNLVFLLDVSGSMSSPNKLPLVKQSMEALLSQLGSRDRVAIVVYAGAAGLVLEPTPADRKGEILDAIEELRSGGSTNGAQGIRLAYELAERSFIEGGANRVILCTDGDFNVGTTSEGELVELIEHEREKGVFLTVLGYGMGNLKDSTMEKLADHGNGNYAYIDSLDEARKVLVEEADAWLVTIAKDVKIQVEMNPAEVEAFRLLGYENRTLAAEDFNDDRKDAGEIGAGHAVVALYEIVPAGSPVPGASVDPLRYQARTTTAGSARRGELGFIKLRFKAPDGDRSELVSGTLIDRGRSLDAASEDFRFSAAVATFGQALRRSELAPGATFDLALDLGRDALGRDEAGRRAEMLRLVEIARGLAPQPSAIVTTR